MSMLTVRDVPSRGDTTLKRILDAEGRNQRWLAHATGISDSTMHRIVHGRRLPDVVEAFAIARTLGRDVAELWQLGGGAADAI